MVDTIRYMGYISGMITTILTVAGAIIVLVAVVIIGANGLMP